MKHMDEDSNKSERNLHTMKHFSSEPVSFINELIEMIRTQKLPKVISRLETLRDDIVYSVQKEIAPLTKEAEPDFGEDKQEKPKRSRKSKKKEQVKDSNVIPQEEIKTDPNEDQNDDSIPVHPEDEPVTEEENAEPKQD